MLRPFGRSQVAAWSDELKWSQELRPFGTSSTVYLDAGFVCYIVDFKPTIDYKYSSTCISKLNWKVLVSFICINIKETYLHHFLPLFQSYYHVLHPIICKVPSCHFNCNFLKLSDIHLSPDWLILDKIVSLNVFQPQYCFKLIDVVCV